MNFLQINYSRLNQIWLLLAVLVFSTIKLSAQEKGELAPVPQFKGVSYQDGLLRFADERTMESIYNSLDRLSNSEENPYEGYEDDCEDFGLLAAFESQFKGYVSARRAFLNYECSLLERGTDPGKIDEPFIVMDEIMASFVSANNDFAVGKSLFWAPYESVIYEITDGNMKTLRSLQKGANPLSFRNVEFRGGGGGGCSANFSINGDGVGTDYSFVFTGTPTPVSDPTGEITYSWTFGDGGTSTVQNPSHTYESAGNYEVCVLVEYRPQEGEVCSDRVCQMVTIEEEEAAECFGAAAFVWNETGNVGSVCFTPVGNLFSEEIETYSWSFGDGTTSALQTPCHTYECDLDGINVSLTVTLENGCTNTITLPLEVTSFNCCEKKAKTKGDYNYAENRKIWYKQKNYTFIFGWSKKIMAKMKNYKHNGNRWKKQKAPLKIETDGVVFTESPEGCTCTNPYPVTDQKQEPSKKKLTLKKQISKKFKSKKDFEWFARYYAYGDFLTQIVTPVGCD